MSIARTAGMEEEAILRAVTTAPAAALGDQWGRMTVSGCADVAVFDYGQEGFRLADQAGNRLQSELGYRCVFTVADGKIVYSD